MTSVLSFRTKAPALTADPKTVSEPAIAKEQTVVAKSKKKYAAAACSLEITSFANWKRDEKQEHIYLVLKDTTSQSHWWLFMQPTHSEETAWLEPDKKLLPEFLFLRLLQSPLTVVSYDSKKRRNESCSRTQWQTYIKDLASSATTTGLADFLVSSEILSSHFGVHCASNQFGGSGAGTSALQFIEQQQQLKHTSEPMDTEDSISGSSTDDDDDDDDASSDASGGGGDDDSGNSSDADSVNEVLLSDDDDVGGDDLVDEDEDDLLDNDLLDDGNSDADNDIDADDDDDVDYEDF
jgi:hypothetical protein